MDSKIRIGGMPITVYLAIVLCTVAAMELKLVPNNMGGGFSVCLVLGVILMWIGDRIPVLNDYGMGTVLCVLVPSILVYVGVIPPNIAAIAKNFFSGYDFTSFLVPGLLVGSILAMNRKTLIDAGSRFIIPMILTIIIATAASGAVGMLLGYGFVNTMLNVAGPILGSGVSASAVPLSEIYANYGGGTKETILTTLTSSIMVANVCTILIACILAAFGKKHPNFIVKGFAGHDGKILRSQENVELSEKEKEQLTVDKNATTFPALQTGFLLTCGIFLASRILAKYIPGGLHFYLYMIVIAVGLKVTNVLPEDVCNASGAWTNFMAKIMTPCTLTAISLGVLNLKNVIKLFSDPAFLILCVMCVVVTTVVSGALCYMFGFYFIEGAIMAGLGLADMGGTGDVAVLSAANRMELLPFLTICSRIGGAINMAWLTFVAANMMK